MSVEFCRLRVVGLAAAATCLCAVLLRPALAVDIYATAVTGQPYGVATIEIPVDSAEVGREFPPVDVTDTAGRVLYPISHDVRVELGRAVDVRIPRPGGGRILKRVGEVIRELTDDQQPVPEQTVARRVAFLFVGNSPLRVRVGDRLGEIGEYELAPVNDPAAHAKEIGQWWRGFTDAARRQIESADYPAWVENYLVAMLAGRVGLPLPDWYTDTQTEDDQLLSTLKLIGGAEGVSEAVFRRAAVGRSGPLEEASMPLPASPKWAPMFSQDDLDDIPVESLATRVPPECFYIRYGSFANFLWFRDLSDEYGGDLSRMLSLRGVVNDGAKRVEDQLHMKMTQLSRMLGGSVIEDQALIGRDLFLADGASIGVLIKSTSALVLRTSLAADRAKLAGGDPAVTLKQIQVAGRPVSFLSSGDNRVRSFLASDGQYVLVANSRTMVERFFEVGQSGQSLAETSAFRLSRQLMPVERGDTIFAYFSPAMLRGLVSPEYLVELRRRLHAKSDVAMVHLARLAAAQESPRPIKGIDELTAAGFLPTGFGSRGDGSGVIAVGDQVMDTLRGARGTFLPIADAKIDAVTSEELIWYSRIAEVYSERFPTIDPIMVGVKRVPLEDSPGTERLIVHAEVAPWEPGKYGKIAQQLGPPTGVKMTLAPDDIIALQAHVTSDYLGPPTHLFAAIKDTVPPEPEEFSGILNLYTSLRELPGYLGAWPQPGALDRLPLGLGRGQPVAPGLSRLIGGLYRYTDGQFSILSFYPDIIQASLPHLAAVDAEDSAQIRATIGNLSGSKIEGWVNAQLYDRARETSVAGANFLSLLSRQLKVSPEQGLRSAQRILGAKLQCTLGGRYEYSPAAGRWISTAWRGDTAASAAPPDYVAPAMTWFRGARASVTQYDDRLVADAVIDIARK